MTPTMKRLYAGAAAGAVLVGSAALVSAQQTPPDKAREPSMRDKASEGNAVREPPGAQQQPPGKGLPKGGAERSDKDQPKAVERPDKDRAKGAERSDKDQPKAVERPDKDRAKGAERSDRDRANGAQRPDASRPGTAQPDLDKTSPGRARLSEQQRSELGVKLRETKVERSPVRVRVDIGSRIPRSVRLHPLPSAIVVAAPAYRGQSYLVQEDGTIVIVDTTSHVVVDVIPASTRTAGLSLTPEQMRFIYITVPRDRISDVRTRLALGAELPAHVELLPFPAEVRMQVPQLVGYRYVVTGNDIVIVDSRDRDIALVITE